MNILLIEDNIKMARNIETVLRAENYLVDVIHTGKEATDKVSDGSFDLLILDLMLPDTDGIDLCKQMRAEGYENAILMLTARINLESKVEGLDGGADDYLTKPFMMDELLARVRSLCRRQGKRGQSVVQIGDLTVNIASKQATRAGDVLPLSPIEMRLLEYLIIHRGQTKSPVEIYESVWGNTDDALFSETLKVHMSRLRKKVGSHIISTIPGYGYGITV